jgi:hypothetical protein
VWGTVLAVLLVGLILAACIFQPSAGQWLKNRVLQILATAQGSVVICILPQGYERLDFIVNSELQWEIQRALAPSHVEVIAGATTEEQSILWTANLGTPGICKVVESKVLLIGRNVDLAQAASVLTKYVTH